MTPKEYAISLLAKGVPTNQVATALGVDDSYISQLKSDPEVAAAILAKQTAATEADINFDEKLDKAEALALEKIENNLRFANMGQAMAAFRILNAAKRRGEQTQATDNSINVFVNLTLPAAQLPRYTKNTSNEIVDVGGRTMATADVKTLDQILAERAAANGLPAQLPGITTLERAASALEASKIPARQAPRRVSTVLSPDIL